MHASRVLESLELSVRPILPRRQFLSPSDAQYSPDHSRLTLRALRNVDVHMESERQHITITHGLTTTLPRLLISPRPIRFSGPGG